MIDLRLDEIFKNKFFNGLQREEFLNIDANFFIERDYSPGDLIIKQDTSGDVMYLITSGEVLITKVIADSEIELAIRRGGDYIGEMALFDNQLRSANVKAITNVKTYELKSEQFFELLNNIDQIKINIIKLINSTVRETGYKLGENSISHNRQISIKESELKRTKILLEETMELKRYIDEQKSELELINRELEKKNKELYQHTIIDDLTQIYSFNHFESLLNTEYSRAAKYNINFSLLVVDIDDFSKFNEDYGHFTGDRILKESTGVCVSLISPEDVIGRVGGDSAAIILPHQSIDEAIKLGQVLRQKCNDSIIRLNGTNTFITISVGVSDNLINNPKSGREILNNAITALNQSKKNGKNCLSVIPTI